MPATCTAGPLRSSQFGKAKIRAANYVMEKSCFFADLEIILRFLLQVNNLSSGMQLGLTKSGIVTNKPFEVKIKNQRVIFSTIPQV